VIDVERSMNFPPKSGRGVTLIELIVVVAIVAILVSVAYPSYREYVRRSNRAAAQAFLMDVSLRQQQRFLDVRSYADSLETLGMATPSEVASFYTLTVTPAAGPPPAFTLTAAPKGAQAADSCGTLQIDEAGAKIPANCW
jgi:type IV pilus assembly protein PilE